MRIVFKADDGSPLALFIQRRADDLGVKPTTYVRALLLREMRAAGVPQPVATPAAALSMPVEDDEPDDDAVLASLLGDM